MEDELEPPQLLMRISSPQPSFTLISPEPLGPPRLLLRLSSPVNKRNVSESSKTSNEQWRISDVETVQDSRHFQTSSTNLTNGQKSPMMSANTPSTHISPNSTPPLLTRMNMGEDPVVSPSLLDRLSHQPVLGNMNTATNVTNLFPKLNSRKRKMGQHQAGNEREKRICPGTHPSINPPGETFVSELVRHSNVSVKTSLEPNHCCASPTISQKGSLPHNGIESSRENPLISTKSSHQCTLSSLMTRERVAWATLKSYLPSLNPNDKSELEQNGQLHSVDSRRPLLSFSPIEMMNSENMQNILKPSLQPSIQAPMVKSFCTTNQSETKLAAARIFCSPTTKNFKVLEKQSSTPTALNIDEEYTSLENQTKNLEGEGRKYAGGLTEQKDVDSMRRSATTDIAASTAAKPVMARPTVEAKPIRVPNYGMIPKYLRYNHWDPSIDFSPCTSDWTLSAKALARPSASEFNNYYAMKTINENPNLFKIITPIHIETFENYLISHPNQPFVKSVIQGLRDGFWPWAMTNQPGYPITNDESNPTPKEIKKADFLRNQLSTELAKDRFSPSFGNQLLPGMYCMPIYAVPKTLNSPDLRWVTDQSFGKFSLNSMSEHEKVTGYPLDNMTQFGEMLLDLERREPGRKRVVWKSDISEAYRILPMHPLWQIKQINAVDGNFYVDRCNTFGGCASGSIFIAFNSLVAWIAKEIKGIKYLGNYVDDSSGCAYADDMDYYAPYDMAFPREQVILLRLWDEIGIPHKLKKQTYGAPLIVIGINVDPNTMTLSLPDDSKIRMINELTWWSENGKKEKIKRWYRMGGWINWGLNVYPTLRPALNNFYPKLKGRRDSSAQIWVNNSIRNDFKWAIKILQCLSGVRLLKSITWGVNEATITILCDACPTGMGFWNPTTHQAFVSPTPDNVNPDLIFYFEALCVLSALQYAHDHSSTSKQRIIIYTDNLNTVDIFCTFRALPAYNHFLKAAVDILTEGEHDLRVLHIHGSDNVVADALSRSNFSTALSNIPQLKISNFYPWDWYTNGTTHTFQPPQHTLGVDEL